MTSWRTSPPLTVEWGGGGARRPAFSPKPSAVRENNNRLPSTQTAWEKRGRTKQRPGSTRFPRVAAVERVGETSSTWTAKPNLTQPDGGGNCKQPGSTEDRVGGDRSIRGPPTFDRTRRRPRESVVASRARRCVVVLIIRVVVPWAVCRRMHVPRCDRARVRYVRRRDRTVFVPPRRVWRGGGVTKRIT